MRITIEDANKWAKNSCPRYCDKKALRKFNRTMYLTVAESFLRTPVQKEVMKKTLAGEYWYNSYPWPFCHSEFANWPEHWSKKYYSLVTDLSGCIVKHDTSYIAWKIREFTGLWPEKTDLIRLTHFDWIQFLAKSDYCELAMVPEPGHKYVGIYPEEKSETVAVWYETTEPDKKKHPGKPVIVTTYLDKEFKILRVKPEKFTWVKIK